MVLDKDLENIYLFLVSSKYLSLFSVPLLSITLEKRSPIFFSKMYKGHLHWPPLKWFYRLIDILHLFYAALNVGSICEWAGFCSSRGVVFCTNVKVFAPKCVHLLLWLHSIKYMSIKKELLFLGKKNLRICIRLICNCL